MRNKIFKFALYYHRLGFFSAVRIIASMLFGKKGEIISLRVPGIVHPVYIRNQIFDQTTFQQIFINAEYEFDYEISPVTIIDAGANIGLASVYFANRFPHAKIICLEPEPGNTEMLHQNIKQYPNITSIQAGLWNKSTYLKIRDEGLGNWGFTVHECSPDDPEAIKAVSLPDLVKNYQLKTLDIVKMDIEGSEKQVLESGDVHEWFSICKLLVIELHDRMKKGTSAALFKTLSQYDISIEQKGENMICRNHSA